MSENNMDGADLLDDLLGTLQRYVAFTDEHSAVAVALWIATTHALPAFECAPRLVATSPQKQCGKTRLLDIIQGTCHLPLATVDATVAAVFRSLGGDHPPTLIIDEADTKFGSKKVAENNEDLRALLNAGHQRGRPALRCVGPNQIPTEFNTFAMAALAGIGTLPDTITDRAVNISMRRRAQGEKVSQFRSRRDKPTLKRLRDQLASWAADQIGRLSKAEPEMPVDDRAADTWEPLVAIADAAGGHWPNSARAACAALVEGAADTDEDRSLAVKLLVDIRQVFTDRKLSFLPSADLVAELRAIEDSPWGDFELNPSKLAYRLKDFGIKPHHNTTKTARGYGLEMFFDAFQRYTRPDPSSPSETPSQQREQSDGSESTDGSTRPDTSGRPTESAAQTLFRTPWTGSDAPPAENGCAPAPPGGLKPDSPGQTDRVSRALAVVAAKRPPVCQCDRAPARSDTGLCDFCSCRAEALAVAKARLDGDGA